MSILTFLRRSIPLVAVSAATFFGTELLLVAGNQAPGGQPPPIQGQPAGGPPVPGQAPAGGRGGGRGNAGAALFTATCSGCHGTPEVTGRAPWLFDQKWLDGTDDDKIANTIRRGVPEKGMVGFTPEQLSDQQIFQLIAYIRTATAT